MSLSKAKLFIGVSILLAFLSIGVFGLLQFNHVNHAAETPMINCPYAENGFSICENILNHINNWRQFSSAIFSPLLVLSLLLFGMVLYFFGKQNFLNQKRYFYKWKYYLDNKRPLTSFNRIIKWLALFENSPSFLHKA